MVFKQFFLTSIYAVIYLLRGHVLSFCIALHQIRFGYQEIIVNLVGSKKRGILYLVASTYLVDFNCTPLEYFKWSITS